MHAKLLAAAVALAFVAGQPAAQPAAPAAEQKASESTLVRYHKVVDFDYVKPLATLPRKIEEGALFIDSRPKARRYDTGHIPGAINIPDTQFEKMSHLLPQDKGRELIFYCQGPTCDLSAKSALKAEKLGYTNIKVYEAGIPDWEARGENAAVSLDFILKALKEKADIVLIDARPARRVAKEGTIPGAINISDTSFEKEIDKLPADKTKEIVYFCQGFACDLSEKSAKKAKALGYTKVRTFPEGHPAYAAATGGGQAAAAAPASARSEPAPAIIEPGKEQGSIATASFERILKESPGSMLIVDVRDAKDIKAGTLPGAVNIPVGEIEKRIGELPKDKPTVFVCPTGARSGEAYDMVKLIDPSLPVYFLDAEIDFSGGAYKIKAR